MRKVCALILAAALLLGLVPLAASAADAGSCGPGVTWRLEDGTLRIAGSGPMNSYTMDMPAPWFGSRSLITRVVVEEGVTRVGDYAFYQCQRVTAASLPASLTEMGSYAFYNASALPEIRFPAGLAQLGNAAFSRCSSLAEIGSWGSLAAIPRFGFNECTALRSVPPLPSTVTSIGDSAFYHCTSLTYVELPDGLTAIGNDAFHASGLTAVTLPSSVTDLGEYVFAECGSLRAIILPQALLDAAGRLTFALCAAELIGVGESAPVTPTPSPEPSPSPSPEPSTDPEPTPTPEPEGPLAPVSSTELEDGRTLAVSANDRRRVLTLTDGDGASVIAQVSLPTSFSSEAVFPDVPETAWFAPYVDVAAGAGLFSGYDDGLFRPGAPMSRAMLVSVLYQLAGSPAYGADRQPFRDVPATAWYAQAASWANTWGIVSGVGGGLLDPDAPITREQLVTMLQHFAGLIRRNSRRRVSLAAFPDAEAITEYARDPMSWAVAEGLVSGSDDGRLYPTNGASRAEAATVLCLFLVSLRSGG